MRGSVLRYQRVASLLQSSYQPWEFADDLHVIAADATNDTCVLHAGRRLRLQTLQVAVAALPVLLQSALLLVATATVTALVRLPYSWRGHWG